MNEQQYERWKDFATRMAATCFHGYRRPTSTWIQEQVANWFSGLEFQEEWKEYTSWDQDSFPLCDAISQWTDYLYPVARCTACSHDDCERKWPHYKSECQKCNRKCQCDDVWYLAREKFDEQWLGPIRCCIRAGIDMACEPSAGVVGFTAGHIRRMYPEGIPEWLFPPDERLYYWLTDKQNGTFADLPDAAGVV
ncbi:MAG: hypothetical protein AAF989_10515, partial [Planctomycetota bacterium]